METIMATELERDVAAAAAHAKALAENRDNQERIAREARERDQRKQEK
jgi:hypothetical protein